MPTWRPVALCSVRKVLIAFCSGSPLSEPNPSSMNSMSTRSESAIIAATLPNPLERDSAHPSKFVKKRSKRIQREMNAIKDPAWGAQ